MAIHGDRVLVPWKFGDGDGPPIALYKLVIPTWQGSQNI